MYIIVCYFKSGGSYTLHKISFNFNFAQQSMSMKLKFLVLFMTFNDRSKMLKALQTGACRPLWWNNKAWRHLRLIPPYWVARRQDRKQHCGHEKSEALRKHLNPRRGRGHSPPKKEAMSQPPHCLGLTRCSGTNSTICCLQPAALDNIWQWQQLPLPRWWREHRRWPRPRPAPLPRSAWPWLDPCRGLITLLTTRKICNRLTHDQLRLG